MDGHSFRFLPACNTSSAWRRLQASKILEMCVARGSASRTCFPVQIGPHGVLKAYIEKAANPSEPDNAALQEDVHREGCNP